MVPRLGRFGRGIGAAAVSEGEQPTKGRRAMRAVVLDAFGSTDLFVWGDPAPGATDHRNGRAVGGDGAPGACPDGDGACPGEAGHAGHLRPVVMTYPVERLSLPSEPMSSSPQPLPLRSQASFARLCRGPRPVPGLALSCPRGGKGCERRDGRLRFPSPRKERGLGGEDIHTRVRSPYALRSVTVTSWPPSLAAGIVSR